MKTKTKPFDAVAASRIWREESGRKLDAMTVPERIAYLEGLRKDAMETNAVVTVREGLIPYSVNSGAN